MVHNRYASSQRGNDLDAKLLGEEQHLHPQEWLWVEVRNVYVEEARNFALQTTPSDDFPERSQIAFNDPKQGFDVIIDIVTYNVTV